MVGSYSEEGSIKHLVFLQVVELTLSKTTVLSSLSLPHGAHDCCSCIGIRCRYWEGLADIAALTAALDNIRGAWLTSFGESNLAVCSNHGVRGRNHDEGDRCDGGSAVGAGSHEDRNPLELTEGRTRLASVFDGKNNPTAPVEGVSAAAQEKGGYGEVKTSSDTVQSAAVVPQTVSTGNPDLSDAGNSQSENTKAGATTPTTSACITSKILNYLPEDTPVPGSAPSKRNSLVRVLGYAVELDSSSEKASVALVAEWPGIGSLYSLLAGKFQVAHGIYQEDLLRWTRQIAEGLTHMNRGRVGCGGGAALRISTRNAYLFPRPSNDFLDSNNVLDVRVR